MKKLTLVIAILLAGQVTAETIIVDQAGKGDFTTIQAGINKASTGDTILVKTGVYIEGVNINKAIAVIGDGAEVTTIYYASVAVQMNTSGAEISNFVDNMPALDSRFLRACVVGATPNVDMSQEWNCSSCGFDSIMEVPLTADFFWPG